MQIGDLVRHIESHSVKGFYLVIEVKTNSPNKAVRIKSVVDGHEYWEVSSYLEAV
jgi:hypothetical protein|tara:strand:+ start:1289 stop:1453 length:165 start_codon:yes stop_codon:yes gene_type:complete